MNQLKKLEAENASLTFQIEKSKIIIQQEQALRVQTPEREAALARYNAQKAQLAELRAELEQYADCDPEEVERKKRAEYLTREAALRWTENVNIAKDHFSRLFGIEKAMMDEYFGIGKDWDELENM